MSLQGRILSNPRMTLAGLLCLAAIPAQAKIVTVCATGCDAATIQAGVNSALDGDTVQIKTGTYRENVTITARNLTLQGVGAVIVDGGKLNTVITVNGPGVRNPLGGPGFLTPTQVVLDGLVITNGKAGSAAGISNGINSGLTVLHSTIINNEATEIIGGGVYNAGFLAMDKCAVVGNTAKIWGGGVASSGLRGSGITPLPIPTAAIRNSTFTANSAGDSGGGVFNQYDSTLLLENNTIVGNSSKTGAGLGIYATSTTTHNNIIANNTLGTNCGIAPAADFTPTFVIASQGHNLSSDATCGGGPGDLLNTQPLLGPLASNGGWTQSFLPQTGSPAINGGDNSNIIAVTSTDQRDLPRITGGTVDIGSVETSSTGGNTNPPPTEPNATPITRGNVSPAGEPGDWPSFDASLSNLLATGDQYLAFVTAATHLLPGDTGWMWNIGVKNLKSGSLVMADANVSGVPSNSWSFFPSISADGSKVAFTSYGNNLTAGDNNGAYDVYVKDLKTNAVQLASSDAAGVYGNGTSGFYGLSLSGDGNSVAFASYSNNLVTGYGSGFSDVYVKNLTTGKVVRANTSATGGLGNYNSYWPSITTDGGKVAFVSWATNLIAGDTNNTADIFVKTLATSAITRLAPAGVTPNGFSTYPAISGNGRYVVFASQATNLVTGADLNNGFDIYLADLQTGAITLVSKAANGSAGNGVSWAPSISADGHYIAFYSLASDLVAGDTNGASDVFMKDTQTGVIWRASRAANGDQANGGRGWDSDTGFAVSISPDGQSVGFDSGASNLVPNDVNGVSDMFINNLIH